VPFYAENRDLHEIERGRLELYQDWDSVRARAKQDVADSDVAMVTSYCPDGVAASELVLEAGRRVRCFYDLDTPVTLARVEAGERVDYLPPGGLDEFDLVLSFTGGRALDALRTVLGARCVAPLYGSVDPDVHRPGAPSAAYRGDFSYLGTFAPDRQERLDRLFISPARRRPDQRFVLGGAAYPEGFPWTSNIFFVRHLPPAEHAAFYASSRLTLNVTRLAMAEMGYCPSGRLFEAAACGAVIVSDVWEGLDTFFRPDREILLARREADVLEALNLSEAELREIGQAARERALAEHTAAARIHQLERILDDVGVPDRSQAAAPYQPLWQARA
jgi:spore maturation protein CgeB